MEILTPRVGLATSVGLMKPEHCYEMAISAIDELESKENSRWSEYKPFLLAYAHYLNAKCRQHGISNMTEYLREKIEERKTSDQGRVVAPPWIGSELVTKNHAIWLTWYDPTYKGILVPYEEYVPFTEPEILWEDPA